MKRLVRDSVHYVDEIFCTAALIVNSLEEQGGGEFRWGYDGCSTRPLQFVNSTYHIRRGDFQYKEVKLPSGELFNNTAYLFRPGELLFIATDEVSQGL
jgi:hypothetical protein